MMQYIAFAIYRDTKRSALVMMAMMTAWPGLAIAMLMMMMLTMVMILMRTVIYLK